jgi:hypothetical protein
LIESKREQRSVPQSLAEASDVQSMRNVVTLLQRNKSLAAAARESSFVRRLEETAPLFLADSGETRLAMLALLFRIAAVAKNIRPMAEKMASSVLDAPRMMPQTLEDADDRKYLGEALKYASGEWKAKYLAGAVVCEMSGEEARSAFTVALISATQNLSEALRALGEAFSTWTVKTNDVGQSRARRLIRVTSALKSTITEIDPGPGDGFGVALQAFTRSALGGEQIEDRPLQIHVAGALLGVLSTTVRFHFSLASDVETYAVIPVLRRWFQSRGWPEELSTERRAVATQISESLVLLAKQGVFGDDLRKALFLVLNNDESNLELRRVANDVPGIPSEIRAWMVSGRQSVDPMSKSEAVQETVLRSVDRDIAGLFRDAADLDATLDRLEDDLAAALQAYEPKLAQTADRFVALDRRIVRRIIALAGRRFLRVRGRAGDIVEFNPIDHEMPADNTPVRVVRIKHPPVEQSIQGSPPNVVLKAEVEGIK